MQIKNLSLKYHFRHSPQSVEENTNRSDVVLEREEEAQLDQINIETAKGVYVFIVKLYLIVERTIATCYVCSVFFAPAYPW